MDLFDLVVLLALAGFVAAIALAATRRDRFNSAVLIALSILVTLVSLALLAIETGFHEADATFDCSIYCTTWNEVIGWTLFLGVLVMLVLMIAVLFRETLRSLRGR